MIKFSQPCYGRPEHDAVASSVLSGQLSEGERCQMFAGALGRHMDRRVVLTSSGTTALHVALLAVGVGPGDEVIVPATTYIATMNAVMYCGATPVVVDIDPVTWCMGAVAMKQAITPRTKAVIPVNLYGVACDTSVRRVVEGHQTTTGQHIWVIGDRAEDFRLAPESRESAADIDCYSFYASKTITTAGEGGCVATSSDVLRDRMHLLVHQGTAGAGTYKHKCLGFNYRMTEVQAAFGLAQMYHHDYLIVMRQCVYDWYDRMLPPSVKMQGGEMKGYWAVGIRTHSYNRTKIHEALTAAGVETRPIFPPVSNAPHFNGIETCVSEALRLTYDGILLPTHPMLTEPDVRLICDTISGALK